MADDIVMADDNLSAVLGGKDNLYLENRPIPEPAENEVLIAMKYVGICGSDIHFWKQGGIGDVVIKEPLVLGHEGSGRVVKLGSGVKNLKIGDPVCIEPAIPCRMCEFCKNGRYNLCPDVKGCSTPGYDGCLCRYYAFPEDLCYKLPENVSMAVGALVEPLSVAVHNCRRAGVNAWSTVLICGAGPIGYLNFVVCRTLGVPITKICITDVCEARLEACDNEQYTETVCVKDKTTEQLIQEITTKLGGSPDITIECSGADSSIKLGIQATKRGGVFMQVGTGAPEVSIPIIDATVREIDIKGSFRSANCFPIALDIISRSAISRHVLITHEFPLEDTVKAYETACDRDSYAFKVLIDCNSSMEDIEVDDGMICCFGT